MVHKMDHAPASLLVRNVAIPDHCLPPLDMVGRHMFTIGAVQGCDGEAKDPDRQRAQNHHAPVVGLEARLSRTLEFQDFVQSLSFVNSLVAHFEVVDHHPDVRIAYGEVTFELTRYDVGGKVTDRDVEVAKKISSVYRARS